MTDAPMPVFGEIHTGLVQHSTALPPAACEEVLAVLRGERVRRFERPISHAVSPETLTGVDCGLALPAGRARAVGTVACRTSITGGRVLQASATVRLEPSTAGRRLPWSHYLARPGRVEVIGRADLTDLATAFARPRTGTDSLDISAVSARAVDAAQLSPRLDRNAPLRAPRTRLRWAALLSAQPDPACPPRVLRLRVEDNTLRTALVSCAPEQVDSVVEFCADLALHDWLLTTLLRVLERSQCAVTGNSRAVHALRPAVEHLLHLWMPAARGDEYAAALWAGLERRPGLSRQWRTSVDRIRDQMALTTIALLEAGPVGGGRGA